jgi:hypothetical protein
MTEPELQFILVIVAFRDSWRAELNLRPRTPGWLGSHRQAVLLSRIDHWMPRNVGGLDHGRRARRYGVDRASA